MEINDEYLFYPYVAQNKQDKEKKGFRNNF
jgi:hypothetical protein